MSDISDKYKNYSIDDLRSVLRRVNKENNPPLFYKAKIELENKIKQRKDIGNFKYKAGTELFLDSYIDEKLSELLFDNDCIIIKTKVSNSYLYLIMIAFISLIFIIAAIINGNYYLLTAYIFIVFSYFCWRILNEMYQYSRTILISFNTETFHINLKRKNNTKFKLLFNLLEGKYTFSGIEGFYWKSTRNIIYEPTSWIFEIRINFIDGTSTPICFASTKSFTEYFTDYLNFIIKNKK